jgi:hypothetical protein
MHIGQGALNMRREMNGDLINGHVSDVAPNWHDEDDDNEP